MNNDDLQHNDLFTLTRMKYNITETSKMDNVLNEENDNRTKLKKYNLLLNEKKNKKQCGIDNINEKKRIDRKRKRDIIPIDSSFEPSFEPSFEATPIKKRRPNYNLKHYTVGKQWLTY